MQQQNHRIQPKKSEQKQQLMKTKKKLTIKTYIKFCLVLLVFIVFIFHFKIEDFFLRFYGKCTKGYISNEIRASRSKRDTYYYTFSVQNNVYKGDSWVEWSDSFERKDSICIVYLPIFPKINRSINGYFEGKFEGCNCEK